MARKRKRTTSSAGSRPAKRAKTATYSSVTKPINTPNNNEVEHPLLKLYYSQVFTLRQWGIGKLQEASRARRRKLALAGLPARDAGKDNATPCDRENALCNLLDTTLVAEDCFRQDAVGTPEAAADAETDSKKAVAAYRWEQWLKFSQENAEPHVTPANGLQRLLFDQAKVALSSFFCSFWQRHGTMG